MTAAAKRHPEPFLTPDQLRELIEQLPASERAQFAWAPTAMGNALRGVEDAEDDEAVDAAVREFARSLFGVLPAIMRMLGNDLSALMDLSARARSEQLDVVREFLGPGPAFDAFEWAVRVHEAFFRLTEEEAPAQVWEEVLEDEHALAEAIPRLGASSLPSVLTLAVVDIAQRGGDPGRAEYLADLAVVYTAELLRLLRSTGVAIDIHQGDDEDARRTRRRRYVDNLRAVVDDSVVADIQDARMERLR